MFGGKRNDVDDTIAVAAVAGAGGTGMMPSVLVRTAAFSCSSKRTASAIVIDLASAAASAPLHAPELFVSRQIFSDVLKSFAPLSMSPDPNAEGGGCRQSAVRASKARV